jgi:hypothetical protein
MIRSKLTRVGSAIHSNFKEKAIFHTYRNSIYSIESGFLIYRGVIFSVMAGDEGRSI